MKTFAFAIVLFTAFTSLQSQTNSDKSVNMYFNTFLDERQDLLVLPSFSYPESSISYAVSFAHQWNHSENLVNEFEIMPLRYCHTDYTAFVLDSLDLSYNNVGYDNQIYNSSVRYSYSYLKGFKRVNLMVGCAGRLFYYNHRIMPYNPDEYFRSVSAVGMTLEFLPALQYELTRNIGIRFDIPLSLADFDFKRMKDENPLLQKRHQISDQIGIYLMRRIFQFRIGMICKISDSVE